MIKTILLTLTLISVAVSYTYNLQTTSECISWNTTFNVCQKWQQTGTINQDTGSCFTGQTKVFEMEKGFIRMKNLRIGDKIKTLNKKGQQIWTEVQGWLHKNEQKQTVYRKLTMQNGDYLSVTGKHSIAFSDNQNIYSYRFASQSLEQLSFYPSNMRLISNQVSLETGMYAPLTSQYSYLVYTTQTMTPVLAHNFANIKNPEFYEPIANIILAISRLIEGQHKLNKEGMHVGAEWMMKYFGFLME